MEEKCFCHLNGYKVKDADARNQLNGLKNAVLADQQNFTKAQQEQARKNIGAASQADMEAGVGDPDWNAAEDEIGYVKNRPMYSIVSDYMLLVDTSVNFAFEIASVSGIGTSNVKIGNVYDVTWSGTAYRCAAYMYGGSVCLGNAKLFGGADTGEPFALEMISENGCSVMKSSSKKETIAIKVERPAGEVVHKLPEKYIPDNVPAIAVAAPGQVVAVDQVDENGKPVSWKTVTASEGGSGDSNDSPYFFVNVTENRETNPYTYSSDKTSSEIFAAQEEGKVILCRCIRGYTKYVVDMVLSVSSVAAFMELVNTNEVVYIRIIGSTVEVQDIALATKEDISPEVEAALTAAKESGEFKGDKGDKGDTGSTGATGSRGAGILKVTTAPTSYTTTTAGKSPIKRMSISTIKTQSGVGEVLVGDQVCHSYYLYHVYYVDTSYAYMDVSQSIRGAAGAAGAAGETPEKGTDYWTEEDKTEIVNDVLAALPTWTGGSY